MVNGGAFVVFAHALLIYTEHCNLPDMADNRQEREGWGAAWSGEDVERVLVSLYPSP